MYICIYKCMYVYVYVCVRVPVYRIVFVYHVPKLQLGSASHAGLTMVP